jgi:hypothetical protein
MFHLRHIHTKRGKASLYIKKNYRAATQNTTLSRHSLRNFSANLAPHTHFSFVLGKFGPENTAHLLFLS